MEKMISIYCKDNHKGKALCSDCLNLLEYSKTKAEKCRFGENKPACSRCSIHCYAPDMREKINKTMKHSGPKIIYRHPILAIRHLINLWNSIGKN